MIGQCNKGHRVDVQNVPYIDELDGRRGSIAMSICLECDRVKCPGCQRRVADGKARQCPNCRRALSVAG